MTYSITATRIYHGPNGYPCSTQVPAFTVEASSEKEALAKAAEILGTGPPGRGEADICAVEI